MHELDQQQLRRAYDRLVGSIDQTDFLCRETRERLLERLGLITLDPTVMLDLGAGTGGAANALQQRYPEALLILLDWSEPMLAAAEKTLPRVCADGHRLPLADNSVDIIVSNMTLPNCAEPLKIFSEARRVLRTPGLFLFNTLGPDTLKNLRRAWAKADSAPHVHSFADMHNIGDALVQAGFREPVMDVDTLQINYRNTDRLFADLRAAGATNFLSARRKGLTTPRRWKEMLAAADSLRSADGAFVAHAEVITGQAWTGDAGPGVLMQDGVASFPVDRLMGRRRGG